MKMSSLASYGMVGRAGGGGGEGRSGRPAGRCREQAGRHSVVCGVASLAGRLRPEGVAGISEALCR